MSFIIREDFLEPNEIAPKIVNANSYDKMMARENYLNFTTARNSEQEYVADWNHHGWEEEGKEPLNTLSGQFNHWRPRGHKKVIYGDWFAVAGKRKLCKGAGLTGAEMRACTKNIITKCGHKPFCVGLLSSNCKDRKAKWETCASGTVVTPEQQAQASAERIVPTSTDTGKMSTGVKVLLSVAVTGTVILIGFAIARSMKATPVKQVVPPVVAG